jgi:hypothetical protein
VTRDEIVQRAFEVFRSDADAVPPLTLRGGNAVDGYDEAEPFDPTRDEATDAYIEGFTFWGLTYLDARSWRHYLPRLIDYTFRHPNDPAMASEALIRSLRPPDRYPPRLATLTAEQEAVVVAFLETLALEDADEHLQADAQQALEEWWLPGARHRPRPEDVAALRTGPITYRVVDRGSYRLTLPEGFVSSGARQIPEESRTVEVWSGMIGGDAHTTVAVNLTPLADRHLAHILERAARGLRAARAGPRGVRVPGTARSERLDGMTRGNSPAEPERITLLAAAAGRDALLLTVRGWPREDVESVMERIVGSLEIAVRAAG